MFSFYISTYGGKVIPDEEAFGSVFHKAPALVDALAVNREPLQYATVREKYNMAVCAAAESIYQGIQAENNNIQSESVGNHSVSYRTTKKEQEYRADAVKNAKLFLSGTGLMYGGLR